MGYSDPMTAVDTEVYTAAQFNANVRDNIAFLKENVALSTPSELTISSGAVTKTKGYHTIDTESDAASDDLDTINSGSDGDIIILQPAHTNRTVIVKDGTGNINMCCDVDYEMDSSEHILVLIYDGTASKWQEVSRSHSSSLSHAEFYTSENGVAMAINTVSIWHGSAGMTAGSIHENMSLKEYITQAITVFADASGGQVTVTSAGCLAAGLATGDTVCITGTTSYNGVFVVANVTTNTFEITDTWVANDATGSFTRADALHVDNSITAGVYKVSGSSSLTPANSNDVFDFAMFINGTIQPKSYSRLKSKAAGDYDNVIINCLVTVASGDDLWVGVKNNTGTGDITIRNANFNMVYLHP